MTTKAISCHVRLRPSTQADGKISPEAITIKGNTVSALNAQGDRRYSFDLDSCHDSFCTQQEVFDLLLPALERVYSGVNTTVFAYGVTGSGKTHTIQGSPQDPGIIPRTVDYLFQATSGKRPKRDISFSYVEILKDEVYDLLGDRSESRKCDIRTNAVGQNVAADVVVRPISSVSEFTIVYESHTILSIFVETISNDDPTSFTLGKICLVDLAGSENNNLTGNDKERMRESSAINTSLTTLGKVVDALNVNAKRRRSDIGRGAYIPYRDSKLTRLLQDSLGGNSQGVLICCLAPGPKYAKDTINTLQFAKKSKSVENRLTYNNHSTQTTLPLQTTHANHIRPHAGFKIHCESDNVSKSGVPRSSSGRRPVLGNISTNAHPTNRSTATSEDAIKKEEKSSLPYSSGMEITESDLTERIQAIVSRELALTRQSHGSDKPNGKESNMLEEATLDITEGPSSRDLAVTHENAVLAEHDVDVMTNGEKENRARVLVAHAQEMHQTGDLIHALNLYRKALNHVPANHKLAMRITEIELALEGAIPTEASDPGSRIANECGVKRPRESEADTNVVLSAVKDAQMRAVKKRTPMNSQ